MNTQTTTLKLGDPCSACGGEYRKAKTVSQDGYERAFFRGEAPGLPIGTDTMNPKDIPEHGALYICRACGHQTRFKPEAPAASSPTREA